MNPCHQYAHVYDRIIDGEHDGEARSVLYRGAVTAARNICGSCPIMAACHAENADEGWVRIIHSRMYRQPLQKPKGKQQTHHDNRLEELRRLDSQGANIHEVLRVVGISARETLHKWCRRNGHLDLYERIAARARQKDNQHTKAKAAA